MSDDSQQSNQCEDNRTSRRWFIQTAGVAGIAGLAGCQGDTSDQNNKKAGSSTTQSGDSSSQPMDPELTLDSLGVPANDVQWNEFNFSNYKWMVQAHVMDPFAVWDPVNSGFVGLLAKDWSLDTKQQKLQVTLNNNYKWHDGKKVVGPVTAKDVQTHFQMEQHMGWSSSEYTKEVKQVDESTVEFMLKGGYKNENFIKFNLLTNVLSHGLPQYEEWVQKFDNAKDQSAKDQISSDLGEFSISSEEMYSYGPFAVQGASRQDLTCVKNSGHPAADKINFPKLVFRYVGSDQKLWQSLSHGQLDGHVRLNIPSDVRNTFPKHVEHTTFSSLGGLSLAFKWDDPVVGDPRVRQAIGYVIDQKAVANNAGADTHNPTPLNTGLAPKYNSNYLEANKYTSYAKNHQKATQLLKDAGFTKNGNKWMTPDGKKFGPDIKTGTTGGPGLLALQTISSHLKQFGINSQLRTMEETSFQKNIWEQGDFQIASGAWGADYPQPYAWFNDTFVENREKMGIPNEISVPPVGKPNGSDDSLTLNFDTAINNLTKLNGQKLNQQTAELAWAWNSMVPQLQIYEERSQTWFTNDEWNYPSLDSNIMQRTVYTPFHYILKTGEFTAKTK